MTAQLSIQSTRDVPFAVTDPTRIPKQRYYDKQFFELERERLWSRVWQMACRLEEIPNVGDTSIYEILDQSVIVTRIGADTIKAYHNVCPHRGAQLASDRGCHKDGFTCPYHGWHWQLNGELDFIYSEEVFSDQIVDKKRLGLREVRVDTWGGCAWITFDEKAPPLRESLGVFADQFDAWQIEDLRTEWWVSTKIGCNWKLAMEAFQEAYHVAGTHKQVLPPGMPMQDILHTKLGGKAFPGAKYWPIPRMMPATVNSAEFVEANIASMKIVNAGMNGMTHIKDIAVAETLRGTNLPAGAIEAGEAWHQTLHNAVMKKHQDQNIPICDLEDIWERDLMTAVDFCFPNFFFLPSLGSACSYRIRPLGPEECLFEIWGLTRFGEKEVPPIITTPTPVAPDHESIPLIDRQDFANLEPQQKALRSYGFSALYLSKIVEGMVSNNHRLIDGYLAGLKYDELTPAAQKVSGPIDMPVRDLGL